MAPRYRKIGAFLFTDEKMATLPTTAKLVGSYVLIGQVNRVGLFVFSPGRAQEELGLSVKIFNSNFDLVLSTFSWSFDHAARVLYIPTWWRYNAPENPNVLVGALDDLNGLPHTPLLKEFAANVRYLPPNLVETFQQRLAERLGQCLAIQESVAGSSDSNRKQDTTPSCPPGGGRGEVRASGVMAEFSADWLVGAWNTLPRGIEPHQGKLERNGTRRLRRRVSEDPVRTKKAWWLRYFMRVSQTEIMHGNDDWHPPLLWALEGKNMEKILSGFYGTPRGGDD